VVKVVLIVEAATVNTFENRTKVSGEPDERIKKHSSMSEVAVRSES
jgi:hypothetical protein